MFYETAQTIGPGWHRSYKPSHYEDMSSRHFRSPGSSPEACRRIIHTDEDFPRRSKDEFFGGRRSPTLPRRVFKEVWTESPNHRFADRPRMFKRVFRPSHWDEEFDREMPRMRRSEKGFDDGEEYRPLSRNFEDEFDKRFSARDLQKDFEEEFQRAEGRVHHIPIMVERRMEEMKSRFGRHSPPPADEEQYADEWLGPQVQNLRKTFEPSQEHFLSKRFPKLDIHSRPRSFTNPLLDSWDPHAVHTLPTRRGHKNSQSFDDSRHPVAPKSVFRSYSETHEDVPRQPPQHSAAFRSHSDGHCPKQTYVTKIEVNAQNDKQEPSPKHCHKQKTNKEDPKHAEESKNPCRQTSETREDPDIKPKGRSKLENPSLQQIAVVLQNVEDLVLRVEAYSGTGRDKQFRFLDEMLTRCMLRLDDVDTEGREDVRSARKAAVRVVQSCIDKLEAKAEQGESAHHRPLPADEDVSDHKDGEDQNDSTKENQTTEGSTDKQDLTSNGGSEQTKL